MTEDDLAQWSGPQLRQIREWIDARNVGDKLCPLCRAERLVIGEGVQMVKSVELLQLRGLILIRHLKNLQQSVTQGPSS